LEGVSLVARKKDFVAWSSSLKRSFSRGSEVVEQKFGRTCFSGVEMGRPGNFLKKRRGRRERSASHGKGEKMC